MLVSLTFSRRDIRVINIQALLVDILSWYESMPRSQKIAAINLALSTEHQARNPTRIDQYYSSSHCIVCRKITDQGKCMRHIFLISDTHMHVHVLSHLQSMQAKYEHHSLYITIKTTNVPRQAEKVIASLSRLL